METIKPVKGYEGHYSVSADGVIFSAITGKSLKPYMSDRYYRVKLYSNGKGKMYMLHRIVAEAFCENSEGKPFVNHIDGDKENNAASNLEWCTASENEKHAHLLGLNDIEHMLRVTRKRVIQKDLSGHILKIWTSMSEAARAVGVDVSGISFCCSGKTRSCGGYVWSLDV